MNFRLFKEKPGADFLFLCVGIIACRFCAAYIFSTFDDAFITYRYSANLARGYGLLYNRGEKVLGTTAPLFALIGTLPAWLSVPIPKFVLVFNICCDIFSFYFVSRHLFSGRSQQAVLFGLLFAIDPTANRISIGGMEANLFFLCSVVAIVLLEKEKRFPAFLLSGVIYFLRPEAVILFGLLTISDWQRSRRFPFFPVLLSLTLVAVPLYAIWHYYGQVLPQSVIAKNQQGTNPPGSLVKSVFFSTPFSYLIFPLAVFGGALSFRQRRALLLITGWITLYAAAYLIRGPWILNWYIYSIATGELVLAAVALDKLSELASLKTNRLILPAAGAVISVLMWAGAAMRLGRSGVETNVFSRLRRDFGDGSAKTSVFFADDIGALGFYTDAYIYDDLMLVSPQAAHYTNARDRIVHLNPDYLFVYADRNYMNLIVTDSAVAGHYHFVKRYSKTGETAFPAAAEISPEYKQDFILMKRNGNE